MRERIRHVTDALIRDILEELRLCVIDNGEQGREEICIGFLDAGHGKGLNEVVGNLGGLFHVMVRAGAGGRRRFHSSCFLPGRDMYIICTYVHNEWMDTHMR